jgi:hypothetical protein
MSFDMTSAEWDIPEITGRRPTAPCRCDKPEPGVRLEDRDGKAIETLCAKCHGAIYSEEVPSGYAESELPIDEQAAIYALKERLVAGIWDWLRNHPLVPYSKDDFDLSEFIRFDNAMKRGELP